jgi:hypothetical protein
MSKNNGQKMSLKKYFKKITVKKCQKITVKKCPSKNISKKVTVEEVSLKKIFQPPKDNKHQRRFTRRFLNFFFHNFFSPSALTTFFSHLFR